MAGKELSKDEIERTVVIWRKSGYSKSKTARDLGVGRHALRNRLEKAEKFGLLTNEDKKREKKVVDRSYFPRNSGVRKSSKSTIRKIKTSELIDQEKLDHAKIVKCALDKLAVDECVYDDILRRDLGISNDRWKDVRDLDEFLDFQVILPNKKRVWCNPEARDELLGLDGVREVI